MTSMCSHPCHHDWHRCHMCFMDCMDCMGFQGNSCERCTDCMDCMDFHRAQSCWQLSFSRSRLQTRCSSAVQPGSLQAHVHAYTCTACGVFCALCMSLLTVHMQNVCTLTTAPQERRDPRMQHAVYMCCAITSLLRHRQAGPPLPAPYRGSPPSMQSMQSLQRGTCLLYLFSASKTSLC